MYDVFIAYIPKDAQGEATPDSRTARELYDRFSAGRVGAFLSDGTAPAEAVEDALHTAKVMFVIASCRAYVEAQQERFEWSRFIGQMQTRGGLRLITVFEGFDASAFPVCMEPTGLLPTQFFGARNYGFGELDHALDSALKVIGRDAGNVAVTTAVTTAETVTETEAAAQSGRKAKTKTAAAPDKPAGRKGRGCLRLFLILLAVLAVLIIAPQVAKTFLAPVEQNGMDFSLQKDLTFELTGVSGDPTSVTVPARVGLLRVTRIGREAFMDCKELESVALPDGIRRIGADAFCGCEKLRSINLPDGLRIIGETAFWGCGSLTSVELPAGVETIGPGAFTACRALTALSVSGSERYMTQDGVLYSRGGARLLRYPAGKTDARFDVPEGVTSIDVSAFGGCEALTEVTLPDGLLVIDRSAFAGCTSLDGVTLPDSLTRLGSFAFADCASLTGIRIPDGVTDISSNAFDGCKALTTVALPEGLIEIGGRAFMGCVSLTDVTVPDTVTVIGESAFAGCTSLTEMTLPAGVTAVPRLTFCDCSGLTEISLPDRLEVIGESAFENCTALTEVTLPDGVTGITGGAFENCTVTVRAPHEADFYGYTPDEGVTWVVE